MPSDREKRTEFFELNELGGRTINLVQQLMEIEGVSQAELARRLDRTRSAVHALLRGGTTSPSLRALGRVFWALGYRINIIPERVEPHVSRETQEVV